MRINKQDDPLKKANKKANKNNRKPGLSWYQYVNTNAGNVPMTNNFFNGGFASGGQSATSNGGMCEQLSDDVLNDLASLPKLANDEYYHIGNIVGDTDFKQEGFHITKDINQCVYIKDQKHPEARYLYKVKFTPKNGIYFEDETGGWRARDIAGMILYNLGEQDVDEAHKIKGENISKDLLNYRGQLRSLQMNNVTSEKGFREMAKILNDCGYDFIQYINRFETDKGKETPTLIPLKTNLQYEIVYDFDEKENRDMNINELLLEAKADEQKLIDFAGEDLANRFFALKKMNRLKSPYNDLYYWLKKDVVDLEDFINDLESEKSATQQRKQDKQGAKVVYEDGNGKVYEITTYDAAKYYGKGTKWCISGNYPGEENRGYSFFNAYLKPPYELKNDAFYFVIENDGTKYAVLIDKRGKVNSIWNAEDTAIAADVEFEEDIVDSKLLRNFLNKNANLKSLTNMQIGFENDPIFLLSNSEYKIYQNKIPLLNEWWWLRDKAMHSNSAMEVNGSGEPKTYGNKISGSDMIRPVIKIPNLDAKIGDRITLSDFDFIVIDKDLAIAEEYISKGKFDDNSNDYETSYIRKFLLSVYPRFAKDFAKYQKDSNESINEVKTKMINIREMLNNIDKETCNEFDLLNLYEGKRFNDDDKKAFAEKLYEGMQPKEIYEYLLGDETELKKQFLHEEYNVYNVTTLEDVIDGMLGNVSEEDFDKTLKLYNKIMRFFGKKANGDHYDEIFAYVDSDWTYDPESYVDVEAFDMEKQASPIKDIRLYLFGLNNLLVEEFNGNIFIYTDSENALYDYLHMVDDYNNGELDNKPSEFNFEEEDNEALNEEEESDAFLWKSLVGCVPVTMVSAGGIKKHYTDFENEDDAIEFCEAKDFEYVDENGFQWDLEVESKINNEEEAKRYFKRYIKKGNKNEAVSGKYSDKFRRLVDKGRKEEDVALVSEVANKVLDYLPEEDAEDLWKDKDFDEVEAKFVLDEGLFDNTDDDFTEEEQREIDFLHDIHNKYYKSKMNWAEFISKVRNNVGGLIDNSPSKKQIDITDKEDPVKIFWNDNAEDISQGSGNVLIYGGIGEDGNVYVRADF